MRTIMETAKKQLVGSLGKLRVWATGHPWGVLGSLVLLVVVVLIFFAALFPDVAPPWLGLGTQRLTEVTVTRQAGDYSFVSKKTIEPPKNLWDWLDLLIVTAVVAVGVFLLNQSARRGESRVADDRQRQETLRNYFDKMSDLLIEEGLKVGEKQDAELAEPDSTEQEVAKPEQGDELADAAVDANAAVVARARTLSILRYLDPERNATVLRFLGDARLVGGRGILRGTDTIEVDFSNSDLSLASLGGAYLFGANLSGANLGWADLLRANLSGAMYNGDTQWPKDFDPVEKGAEEVSWKR